MPAPDRTILQRVATAQLDLAYALGRVVAAPVAGDARDLTGQARERLIELAKTWRADSYREFA